MPVCGPCRDRQHDRCTGCGVCQHRPPQTPEASGTDAAKHTDESSQP